MGFALGFLPWVLYWALIGNVPFRVAACVVLGVAVAVQLLGRRRGEPRRSLEVGSLAVFAVLTVAAFVVDDAFLQQWMQPLSNAGIFLVALVGLLIGRPFVREYATASVDERTARSDGFATITRDMTWLWVGVFAAMTVVSAVPPLVGDAAAVQGDDTLSIVCYWVLPYVLLGLGGLVSGTFPSWFEKRSALVDKRESEETPRPAGQRPAPADRADGPLVLDLPAVSGHDQPFDVTVSGAPAGAALTVVAGGQDLFAREWRSEARFTVPASGVLDLDATAPVAGDWTRADGDAVLTAMRFAEPDTTPDLFVPPADPWRVTVTAGVEGVGSVRRTVLRSAGPDGERLLPTDVDGRPGLLVLPAGDAPAGGWPAVACFGGSEGGFESQVGLARMLAARGYAALAASWISEAEAAEAIASVPLERFLRSVQVLAGRPEVDASRTTAMAVSRGAEGLLAAMSTADAVPCRGLVLVSPSSVSWQAIGGDGEVPDTPSWTSGGRPVPWRPVPTGVLMKQLVRNAWRVERDRVAHRPTLLRLRAAYAAGLADGESGTIAAEHVSCPLLLLSGSEDAVWPAEQMAAQILDRRPAGSGDRHLTFRGAGHLIRLGALPTDAQWTGGVAFGGEPDAQADAQRAATAAVSDFLGAAVTADRAPTT